MADGLVAALARCQAKFPAIVKSHTNPAFKGSQYADVADVLAAVRPVLAAEGIVVSQYTQIDDSGGVTLITSLLYGPDGLDVGISSTFPLHTHGLNAQGVGSLMTYHRRYQLCAILGVHPVGDDDDGNLAATSQTVALSRPVPAPKVDTGYDFTSDDPSAAHYKAPLPPVAISQPDKPLAAMTMRELLAFATENAVSVSGSKSDIVRTLEPLVRAASGEEPFGLDGERPAPRDDPHDKPFTPTVADELRNRPPAVRASIRSGGDA